MFSVLLAVHKSDKIDYIKKAFVSLFEQTLKPSEIIIVADGPIPTETHLLIEKLKNIFVVQFIPLQKSLGLGGSLRIGLSASRYSLVARFDLDDICELDRFEKQVNYLNLHPNIDICGSYATLINETDAVIDKLKMPVEHIRIRQLIWSCPIIHPSVMFRKEKILEIGNYKRLSVKSFHEDYELWIRSIQKGLKIYNIPDPLIKYRITETKRKKRNKISNGLRIIYYGLFAWYKYDGRLLSLMALIYPVIRPLLPKFINEFIYRFDPRQT